MKLYDQITRKSAKREEVLRKGMKFFFEISGADTKSDKKPQESAGGTIQKDEISGVWAKIREKYMSEH